MCTIHVQLTTQPAGPFSQSIKYYQAQADKKQTEADSTLLLGDIGIGQMA